MVGGWTVADSGSKLLEEFVDIGLDGGADVIGAKARQSEDREVGPDNIADIDIVTGLTAVAVDVGC